MRVYFSQAPEAIALLGPAHQTSIFYQTDQEAVMARGKRIDENDPVGAVETAVIDGDWALARKRMAAKLARMFDATDSARDVKSISLTLDTVIDKCESNDSNGNDDMSSPLAEILAEAEAITANA